MKNISARYALTFNRQTVIKTPRAMRFSFHSLQINATLLFVVGRFPNLKVNGENMKNLTSICEIVKVQWKLEQEGRKWVESSFYETCSGHIWEGNMFSPGIRTSYRATSLRITSCWLTNHSHGCFGQKPNVERWTHVCQHDFLLSQVPWIVKTDDDMINNIWKLGALVEALKFQRWPQSRMPSQSTSSQEHNHLLDQDGTGDQD